MRKGIALTASQINAVMWDHISHRLRVIVDGQTEIWPYSISCDATESYQQWSVKIKNNGSVLEGSGAGSPAVVQWSCDGQSWVDLMTGFISTTGAQRSQGYVYDDFLTFSITDKTQVKGTKIKPMAVTYAGLKVCDPTDSAHSIVHILGNLMGVSSFDVGNLSAYVKDVFTLGDDTVWSELQNLADAFDADLSFNNIGSLYFHSPLELDYTEPAQDWTINGEKDTVPIDNHTEIIGSVSRATPAIVCNKAKCSFSQYTHYAERIIYKDTTNYNSKTDRCSIVIEPGCTYPEDGVLSLDYKNPDTGNDYPYATDIVTPTIGENANYDIAYTGGRLSLVSFDGSTAETERESGASQIILKNNSTTLSCTIWRFTLRGCPFGEGSEVEVIEKDASITEDVNLVEKEVDGKYATGKDQIDAVLARMVAEGKAIHRQISFTTMFLPFVQRGEVVRILIDGESSDWKVDSYSHSMSGTKLSTMRTSLSLTEVLSFTPSALPEVKQKNINTPSVVNGKSSTYQWLVLPNGQEPETLVLGYGEDIVAYGDYSIGYTNEAWSSTKPETIPAGYCLWVRETTPTGEIVIYHPDGTDGADATGFTLASDKVTYSRNSRGVVTARQTSVFTCTEYNMDVSPTWLLKATVDGVETTITATDDSVSPYISITIDGKTATVSVGANCKLDAFTLTCSITGYGFQSIIISAVNIGEATANYFGVILDIANIPVDTLTFPLITGDYFMWGAANYSADNSTTYTYLKGELYAYNATTSTWASATDNNLIFNCFDDYASLGDDVDSAVMGTVVIKKLIALAAVVKNFLGENVTVGPGTGKASSGFRFRAMTHENIKDATSDPVFDVMYGDNVLFKVNPSNGRIFLGKPNANADGALNGFMFNPDDGCLHSKDDNTIIDDDGNINAKNVKFKGGNFDDITANGSFTSDEFSTQKSTDTPISITASSPFTHYRLDYLYVSANVKTFADFAINLAETYGTELSDGSSYQRGTVYYRLDNVTGSLEGTAFTSIIANGLYGARTIWSYTSPYVSNGILFIYNTIDGGGSSDVKSSTRSYITSTNGSWDSDNNKIYTYFSQSLLDQFSTIALDGVFDFLGTITYNKNDGTSETITSNATTTYKIKLTTTSVSIYNSDSTLHHTSTLGNYLDFNYTYAITVQTSLAGIKVMHISPTLGSTYSIGQSSKRFLEIFGDTIDAKHLARNPFNSTERVVLYTGPIGAGNIVLNESWDGYDFLIVTGSNDNNENFDSQLISTKDMAWMMQNYPNAGFTLWKQAWDYWMVTFSSDFQTLIPTTEDGIIHLIEGIKL